MPAKHLDLLTRDFLSGSSNPYRPFDSFYDLQDPTFLSFKIDFFPDLGMSMPTDAYSAGGLFRPSTAEAGAEGNSFMSYTFYDSAAEYLARIGAPARQAALEQFISLLKKLTYQAPWYFQSVGGLAEMYKIEKNINFRAKDKVLTIDCLESIDMRMSLLADLYRFVSFDALNHREVLPYNLRTFSMNIHVLEMRRFNTTFGVLADSLAQGPRPTQGEDKQKELIKNASNRNVFGAGSTLFSGTFDNIGNVADSVNNALGGLFTNLGSQPGPNNLNSIKSAFEAISVQTFSFRDCEFDFFSEAPAYLDSVSVKDSPEATFKFKINVGKIEKVGVYPFYDYVISEWTKNTRMNKIALEETKGNYTDPYFEPNDLKSPERGPGSEKFTNYREYRESIFPTSNPSAVNAETDAYKAITEESKALRRGPLEGALSRIVQATAPFVNNAINQGLGELTGGILGTAPLGNVYGERSFIQQATEALNDFLTPGNQLTTDQTSAQVSRETLNQDIFGTPPGGQPHTVTNIYQGVPPLPTQQLGDENVFE